VAGGRLGWSGLAVLWVKTGEECQTEPEQGWPIVASAAVLEKEERLLTRRHVVNDERSSGARAERLKWSRCVVSLLGQAMNHKLGK
jgi:lipopolysaccharide export system protein LptC